MAALGTTIAFFAFFFLVGYGVLAALRGRRYRLLNLLLAPPVGISVVATCAFSLNLAGLPVPRFAAGLAVVLALSAVAAVARFVGRIPLRTYAPFAAILLVSLALTGRPMFASGFDWLSMCNDDMANYCLGAKLYLDRGYYDAPDVDAVVAGLCYSDFYWFMYVPAAIRNGCELLLAMGCTIVGRPPHELFMPLILAFHLSLISSGGALILRASRNAAAALLGCGLLSASALVSLGTIYQLLAQIAGLSILAAATTSLLRLHRGPVRLLVLRHGVVGGVLVVGIVLVYPEVLPFLALGGIGYAAWSLIRRPRSRRWACFAPQAAALGVTALALNVYLPSAVRFFLTQQSSIQGRMHEIIRNYFPQYLLPSGLANLWGLQSVFSLSPEPWLSTTVALGAVLSLAAVAAAFRMAARGNPAAFVCLVMFAVTAYLFALDIGFGLYKTAMFLQPFLAATVVCWWFRLSPTRPVLRWAPPVLLAVLGLPTQQGYVAVSTGASGSGEVPQASQLRINQVLREEIVRLEPGARVICDQRSSALQKFAAAYLDGRQANFPAGAVVANFYVEADHKPKIRINTGRPHVRELFESLFDKIAPQVTFRYFDLHAPDAAPGKNGFWANTVGDSKSAAYCLASGGGLTVTNRRTPPAGVDRPIRLRPMSELRNHLTFVSSHLGANYFPPPEHGSRFVSMSQLERDLYFPNATMVGVGRHLLFQVLRPTSKVRLVLELTCSLQNDGENRLPPAEAVGDRRIGLPLVGRGAARVVSPPFAPQSVAGDDYVALDLGVDGKQFVDDRRGLMTLWGGDVARDFRHLVGFARNVSLIADDEYQTFAPPQAISDFPHDLSPADLEFSGLYEDGWASEAAYVRLSRPEGGDYCVVRGQVPDLGDANFTTELVVSLDGKAAAPRRLGVGEFEIQVPATTAPRGIARVDLRFSAFQRLPGSDKRPVAARLSYLGFDADEPADRRAATAARRTDRSGL